MLRDRHYQTFSAPVCRLLRSGRKKPIWYPRCIYSVRKRSGVKPDGKDLESQQILLFPSENAVHSLEHGAVWATYQPDLPKAAVDKLQQMMRGHSHLVLSPYPGLPQPVVASGWGMQLQVPGADDPRLARFLKKYEQGPQTREPGAECTGGVGNPTG